MSNLVGHICYTFSMGESLTIMHNNYVTISNKWLTNFKYALELFLSSGMMNLHEHINKRSSDENKECDM